MEKENVFFVEEKKKRRRKRRKNIEGKEKLLRGRWMGWAYGRKSKALNKDIWVSFCRAGKMAV